MKDIKGLEGLYAITEDGQIWSYRRQKFLKTFDNGQGYLSIVISIEGKKHRYKIHKLVAETFIPNPDNLPVIDHIDENKHNNSIENLRWVTHRENILHSGNNLKPKPRRPIRCIETGVVYPSMTKAAAEYGVCTAAISHALKGKQKTSAGMHWEYA